jgi:ElaB/YqjD/DUF883 family membrane-anchored ribosome-binding protein
LIEINRAADGEPTMNLRRVRERLFAFTQRNDMDSPIPTPTRSNGQEGLAHGLRHMVDAADHFLEAAAQTGDARFEAVRSNFVEQVRQMRAQLDELEDSAIRKARRVARRTDRTIQSHPYAAMSLAATAGLLIGFLAARR